MKISKRSAVIVLAVLFLAVFSASAEPATVGGDRGTFIIHSDIDGAKVTFVSVGGDEYNMGTIENGILEVSVYLTATPFKEIRVEADGYETKTVEIATYPEKDGTLDVSVLFNEPLIGGDRGTFIIRSDVNGAKVTFVSVSGDEYDMGTIENGTLAVPVYLTATPFKEIRIEADGYETKTVEITAYPEKNGSLDIDAPLKKTASVPGPTAVVTGLILLAAGAFVRRKE